MNAKEAKRISELFITIGKKIAEEPGFLWRLEAYLQYEGSAKKVAIDDQKIDKIDLFQLVKEEPEEKLSSVLSELEFLELKALLKKYRFGSPSRFKNKEQIKSYILNQLRQRKTDVFEVKDE